MNTTTLAIVAVILIIVAGAAGYFAGKGATQTVTTTVTTTQTVTQTAAGAGGTVTVTQTVTQQAEQAMLIGMSWDQIVQKAKEEGEVNWYGYGAEWDRLFYQKLAQEFEKEYGIKVNYVHGDWFSTIEKLKADKQAGKEVGEVDVAFVWSVPFKEAMDQGLVWDFPVVLVLPNAKKLIDPSLMLYNDMVPVAGKFVPFVWWQVVFIYNKKYVDENNLPNFDTLLDWAKANPGKFTYSDPNKGGSGHTFLISVIYWLYGYDKFAFKPFSEERADKIFNSPGKNGMSLWEYLNELEKYMYQPGNYPAGNAAAMELFAREEVWLEPQWLDVLAEWIKEGRVNPDEVGTYDPDPGIAVGGFDGMFIPWNAPNKFAAMVLINYLISEEVQYKLVTERGGIYPVVQGVWEKVPDEIKQKWKMLPIEELEEKFLQRHAEYMFYAMKKWTDEVARK